MPGAQEDFSNWVLKFVFPSSKFLNYCDLTPPQLYIILIDNGRGKQFHLNNKKSAATENLIKKMTEEEEEEEEEEDLISELPDAILHLILSLLDMKYVIQTSLLSTRWRYLWASLPFLNFDEEVYHRCMNVSNAVVRSNILNFVDRVLIFRSQNSNIQAFRFSGGIHKYTIYGNIFTWIHTLARHNVEELDLQFGFKRSFDLKLPNCMFTWKSLTTLCIDLRDQSSGFRLPDSVMSLPSLKTLHLKSLQLFTGKKTENFMSSGCPVLETLIMSNCTVELPGELIISALQLKKLVVTEDMSFYPNDCGYSRLSLFAPKLTSFRCKHNTMNDYSLVNISSLENADLDTISGSSFYENHYGGGPILDEEKKVYTQNVIKCLKGIRAVRSLVLSAWLLEDVYKVHKEELGNVLETFSNLTFLKMRTPLSRDHCRVIKYLLEKCPNAETLVFEKVNYETEYIEECPQANDESWGELLLLWQCNLHNLKVVEIQNAIRSANELELLKFLLKNAMVLEKMVIHTSKVSALYNGTLATFSEELVIFPRASSCTEITIV